VELRHSLYELSWLISSNGCIRFSEYTIRPRSSRVLVSLRSVRHACKCSSKFVRLVINYLARINLLRSGQRQRAMVATLLVGYLVRQGVTKSGIIQTDRPNQSSSLLEVFRIRALPSEMTVAARIRRHQSAIPGYPQLTCFDEGHGGFQASSSPPCVTASRAESALAQSGTPEHDPVLAPWLAAAMAPV